jgi:protein-disulfide isomerase
MTIESLPMRRRTFFASIVLAASIGCTAPVVPPDDVAATVGKRSITMAQVDAKVRQVEPETWQALFDARQRAVASMIDEQLLAAAATRYEIDADSLVSREIEARVTAATDEEVRVFYAQNAERMGGQPLTEMQDRIHDFLTDRQVREARGEYLAGLRAQAGVEILLEPPRVYLEITDAEPAKGPANAPIVLVEYSDFECPYCARAQSSVKQVLQTYGDKIRYVYRDFPLPMHSNANQAAQAGQCAGEQGQFWEYHDVLFDNFRALGGDDLQSYATQLGLDLAKFNDCLESGRHADGVDYDLASGQANGVSGTPAFFINGRLLSGAQPFGAFKKIIDEELQRHSEPL